MRSFSTLVFSGANSDVASSCSTHSEKALYLLYNQYVTSSFRLSVRSGDDIKLTTYVFSCRLESEKTRRVEGAETGEGDEE